MEFLIELIIECILEGSMSAGTNKKLPKWFRILCTMIILLFFSAVIGLFIFTGIITLKENVLISILMFACALFFLIMGIVKFQRLYRKKTDENCY